MRENFVLYVCVDNGKILLFRIKCDLFEREKYVLTDAERIIHQYLFRFKDISRHLSDFLRKVSRWLMTEKGNDSEFSIKSDELADGIIDTFGKKNLLIPYYYVFGKRCLST